MKTVANSIPSVTRASNLKPKSRRRLKEVVVFETVGDILRRSFPTLLKASY